MTMNDVLPTPFHSLAYQQKHGIKTGLNRAPSSFTSDLSHLLVENNFAVLWGHQLLNSPFPSTLIISVEPPQYPSCTLHLNFVLK